MNLWPLCCGLEKRTFGLIILRLLHGFILQGTYLLSVARKSWLAQLELLLYTLYTFSNSNCVAISRRVTDISIYLRKTATVRKIVTIF